MSIAARNKFWLYFTEIGKWILIAWLLLPIASARHGLVDFVRVATGVILFVIFAGKLLYDVVFFPRKHVSESRAGKDLLSMIGIVLIIAFMILALVLFVTLYLMDYVGQMRF